MVACAPLLNRPNEKEWGTEQDSTNALTMIITAEAVSKKASNIVGTILKSWPFKPAARDLEKATLLIRSY